MVAVFNYHHRVASGVSWGCVHYHSGSNQNSGHHLHLLLQLNAQIDFFRGLQVVVQRVPLVHHVAVDEQTHGKSDIAKEVVGGKRFPLHFADQLVSWVSTGTICSITLHVPEPEVARMRRT